MHHRAVTGGFIKWLILIIVVILILSYFGLDLQELFDNPQTKENFKAFFGFLGRLWTNYLKGPAQYIWDEIIIGFVWEDVLYPLIFEDEDIDLEAPESPEIGVFGGNWAQVS